MTQRTLHVLFLTRYPVDGASSRYRVHQYIEHLESLQVSCTVQSLLDDRMYSVFFTPGRSVRKFAMMLNAVARRLAAVSHYKRYDIIYLQRELLPFAPPWIERYLKHRGVVLLFDYDDALFIHKPSRYNPIASFLRSAAKTTELFTLADCVVAGNDWLRDQASKAGARAVTIEVAEDTQRIPMHRPHTNSDAVTIGWLGSTSTVKYLALITPALQRIAREFPCARFEIVGGGAFSMPDVPWSTLPWSLTDELQALARFDIGLMPLPDEDWARGKSGGKARTYMAAGVVPVCSAIGYNLALVRHQETGYLCRDTDDWYHAIKSLIENPPLRQTLALAARADIESRFRPQIQAQRLRQLFDDVLDSRAQPILQRNDQG